MSTFQVGVQNKTEWRENTYIQGLNGSHTVSGISITVWQEMGYTDTGKTCNQKNVFHRKLGVNYEICNESDDPNQCGPSTTTPHPPQPSTDRTAEGRLDSLAITVVTHTV
jgi:hypothetical protein